MKLYTVCNLKNLRCKPSLYNPGIFGYLLWPFSWIYRAAVFLHRRLYVHGFCKIKSVSAPVIVVGNITVGGAGKTPVVIALVDWLKQAGWRPGVISRGYGGSAIHQPQSVIPTSDPRSVGDEPILIAQKTGCPLVVCKNRVAAANTLLKMHDCNIIVSDDGLQHWALKRDIEISVVDGRRRLGNNFCLPAGPLREPSHRLHNADFIINNGGESVGEWRMDLVAQPIYQLINPQRFLQAQDLQGRPVHGVAGIGHPKRFFNTLEQAGFQVIAHPFRDHHFFKAADFNFGNDAMIIMTEKDAVKCRSFADHRFWCLPVRGELPANFWDQFKTKLTLALSSHGTLPLSARRPAAGPQDPRISRSCRGTM